MKLKGFTLAELLIALAILGVIATFTIPKILDSGSSSKHNAIAKEVASMVSGAYQNLKLNQQVTGATTPGDLVPYMNYVKVDSTTSIDNIPPSGSFSCSVAIQACYLLHNGGMLWYRTDRTFGETSSTSAIEYGIDPDGEVTGVAGDTGKAVQMISYANGRLRTYGTIEPNTKFGGAAGTYNPDPNNDPDWFSWSN